MLTLKTALSTYGHTRALKDGSVRPALAHLEYEEFSPQSAAFQKMVPHTELDVAEIVLTHYLMARDHGRRFIALPVFPSRQFHYAGLVYNVHSGIKTPKDLEGKRVGVRTYGVSRGFWARAVLSREHGVDVSRITWVVNAAEDLPEYQPPPNVELVADDVDELLQKGQLDAAIGVGASASDDIRPLISKPTEAAAASFEKTGVYPINHILVLRKEIVEQEPGLPVDLFNAFKESKAQFLGQIDAGAELDARDRSLLALRTIVGPDPVPYGIEANRPALEEALEEAASQGLTSRKFSVEELFDSSTLQLS
jgi:4,5-dihydroxyphthalate decarboxylase